MGVQRGNDGPCPSTERGASVQQHTPQKRVRSRAASPLLAMLVVAGALVAVNQWRPGPMRDLVAAFESQKYRTIEGRLTGGFEYRPVAPVTRAAAPAQRPPVAVLSALTAIHTADSDRRSVSTLHQRGISYLLTGHWDKAVDVLDDALRLDTQFEDRATGIAASNDPALLTDISVAHHAYARDRHELRSYVIAAEAAQRAWSLDKTPDTAWNRAVATAALHLRQEALAAWHDYLKLDPDSQWADEARKRMRALSRPTAAALWKKEEPFLARAVAADDRAEILRIVRAFPFETRMLAEHTHLPDWAADSSQPNFHLRFCRQVGRALSRASGESLLADTVADIDRASAARRAEIARGLLVYKEGRAFYVATDFARAGEKFRVAADILVRAGSPFASVVRMYLASCDRHVDDRRVIETIDTWLASGSLDERRHPAVAAQVHWVRGLSSLRLGRPQAAIDAYERALTAFQRLDERNNIARMHLILSEAYDYVGNTTAAWTHRLSALELRAQDGDYSSQLLEVLRMFAAAALRERLPAVAIVFLNAQIAACDEPSRYDMRYHALLLRARAHRANRDAASATADIREARRFLPQIVDPAVREQSMYDPEVVRDRLSLTADLSEREEILRRAIQFAFDKSFAIPLVELYLQQGREDMRAGRWDAAVKALSAAIDRLEKERESIDGADERGSFLAARRSVHDTLVELLATRGDHRRAFEVVERSRARVLLDRVGDGAEPVPLDRIQAALDDETAIVEYARVGGRTGVWLVTRRNMQFFPIDDSEDDLRRLVDRFRIAIREGSEYEAMDLARVVHDALIRPWYGAARGCERLVFVPGHVLSGLPFAATHDGESFLIDRHVISTAPSASVLLACLEYDRTRVPARESALIIAPETGVSGIRDGSFLAASRAEVAGLEKQYPNGTILEGRRATRQEFAELAPFSAVIHFAGHATPERSAVPRLVFTPEGKDTEGFMHAEDIAALDLSATRVVMIASCNSGKEQGSVDNGGASSLARAFLAARVPIVIGSYWEVDDVATARLSQLFHSFLGRGEDAATALRSAQLEMLTSRDAGSRRMGSWAAFAAIGGTQRQTRR